MNRIYKKIFNKARGCFVAVSEVITSASQNGGKAGSALAAGAVLMALQGPVQALVTIDGDVVGRDSRINFNSYGNSTVLNESLQINGNFTWNLGPAASSKNPYKSTYLGISVCSDKFGPYNNTLTVNGNFNITNASFASVAYLGDRSGDTYGNLNVAGDLFIENNSMLYLLGADEVKPRATAHANLSVGGTIYNKGSFISAGDSITKNGYSSLSVNQLVNTGLFSIDSYNLLSATFNDVTIDGGSFQQLGASHFVINNSLTLNAGVVYNVSNLVVGHDSGNFIISKTLKLNGGGITNTSSLTQGSGTINVTKGNYTFGTLTKSNGKLTNSATLAFNNFNQSNGTTTNTGNLTIGNSDLYGSLNSSGTLTLTGNVTTRGNLSSTGTLNNKGTWTENNAYYIAGTLNNSGTTTFQNGFTFTDNGRLNSTGTVQTSDSSNIFDSLGTTGAQDLHFVSLNSKTEQEVKTSLNDFFQKYLPGTLSKTLADHASFTGGKVVISGVNITKTQEADLKNAFKSKIYLPFPA